MKSSAGLRKLAPELSRSAREAREALATKLYDRETVRNALTSAAGRGFVFAEFAPTETFDLRDTEAAKALEHWIAECGLSLRWDAKPGPASLVGETIYSAVIVWTLKDN